MPANPVATDSYGNPIRNRFGETTPLQSYAVDAWGNQMKGKGGQPIKTGIDVSIPSSAYSKFGIEQPLLGANSLNAFGGENPDYANLTTNRQANLGAYNKFFAANPGAIIGSANPATNITPAGYYGGNTRDPYLYNVNVGGKSYLYAPTGWKGNEGGYGTANVAALKALGGTPYEMPGTSGSSSAQYSGTGYLFDPKFDQSKLQSAYGYTPGVKGGQDAKTLATVAAMMAGPFAAAVAPEFMAGAATSLGLPASQAAAGGAGLYDVAPGAAAAAGGATGGIEAAGAGAAGAAGGNTLLAAAPSLTATDVTAGTTGAIGAGTAAGAGGGAAGGAAAGTVPMDLASSTAASNIITGPGGTLAGLGGGAAGGAAAGGLLGGGGVLGTGLTGAQAAVLGAGLAGSLLLGPRQIPQSGYLTNEQKQQGAQGQQLIQNAINGKLTPSQQASIDEWKTTQMAGAKQYLINSGQSADSTAMLGLQANIDRQAIAIQQGFLDQSFQQGIAELGIADSATAQLIQGRLIQQQATSQALQNFMMTYGLMSGWGG